MFSKINASSSYLIRYLFLYLLHNKSVDINRSQVISRHPVLRGSFPIPHFIFPYFFISSKINSKKCVSTQRGVTKKKKWKQPQNPFATVALHQSIRYPFEFPFVFISHWDNQKHVACETQRHTTTRLAKCIWLPPSEGRLLTRQRA